MKRLSCFALLFFTALTLAAQQPSIIVDETTPAAKLAHHIADKMADSLGLTSQQRAKIFAVNLELHKQKASARTKPQDRDSIGKDLQQIENKRNGLYKTVLTPEQFQLYLEKKRLLVSNQ
jgi:hypothetical protein